jgi:nucleoid-associated protein YgaU
MGVLDKLRGKDGDDGHDRPRADFSDVGGNAAPRSAAPSGAFSDVNASSSSASASAPVERERSYTVVAGDSLSKIAKREYGDAAQWHRIYEANKSTISNPDLIQPGQVLTLPADA